MLEGRRQIPLLVDAMLVVLALRVQDFPIDFTFLRRQLLLLVERQFERGSRMVLR